MIIPLFIKWSVCLDAALDQFDRYNLRFSSSWYCFTSSSSSHPVHFHRHCQRGSLFWTPRCRRGVERAVLDGQIARMTANIGDKGTAGRQCVCGSDVSAHQNEQNSTRSRTTDTSTASLLHTRNTHTFELQKQLTSSVFNPLKNSGHLIDGYISSWFQCCVQQWWAKVN